MASISWDGDRAIVRVVVNGKQKNISWGIVSKSVAETAAGHIEALNIANSTQSQMPKLTQQWVAALGLKHHTKLANVGLVEPREEAAQRYLGEFIDAYIANKKTLKPYSIRNLKGTRNKLTEYFGERKPINKITEGDAEDWEQSLRNDEYAEATISGYIKDAKQFFSYAVRRKLIPIDPFDRLKAGKQTNDERLQYIDVETITKVLNAATDTEWKCVIALSRFLGLRCPSEILDLTWNDVDFVSNIVTIKNHKTGDRTLPLFVEVRPYLQALHDERKVGIDTPLSSPVIMRYRDTNANLRTRLLKTIKRAQVDKWERIFHNLRASRVIECADNFPSHVCAKWFGHSEIIAMQHYLKVTKAHYERAVAAPVTLTPAVAEILKSRTVAAS
jgi:integrase